MSKVTGIDAVYYSVRDIARAKAFYTGFLDVKETTWENEHGAEWVLADGTAFGVGKTPEYRVSGCVLFGVADLHAVNPLIEKLGGKLDGEVREFPGICVQQWCSDPDGNSFVLHQRTA
jgi:predicted enzyme related to lactoylglutathione lyase